MATVVGITAARADEIEDASIVSGAIDSGSGHLLLTTHGGTIIDAGLVTQSDIDLAEVPLTGTLAEFNTALSDGNFASLAGTETLTNKTLTSPIITGIGNEQSLFKTADETLVSSPGPQNDDHLFFSVEAMAKYLFEGTLFTTIGAGGLAIGLSGPTLVAMKLGANDLNNQYINGYSPAILIGLVSNCVQISGYIQCSAAGVVNLQWTQATSDVAGTTLRLGSFLRARRVA